MRAVGAAVVVTVFVLLACGCVSQKSYDRLHDKLLSSQARVEKLEGANKDAQLALADTDKQIRTLQALGPKRLAKLYHVQRINLGRLSGGVDLDDKAGHDAVRVYLSPIDQHGSVIKAAGAVKIQLFNLAAKPDANLIGTYEWSVDQMAGQWASFMVYHYSLTCKWPGKAPAHEEVTIRAEFTDYLTGKKFTAQRVCKIELLTAK